MIWHMIWQFLRTSSDASVFPGVIGCFVQVAFRWPHWSSFLCCLHIIVYGSSPDWPPWSPESRRHCWRNGLQTPDCPPPLACTWSSTCSCGSPPPAPGTSPSSSHLKNLLQSLFTQQLKSNVSTQFWCHVSDHLLNVSPIFTILLFTLRSPLTLEGNIWLFRC